MSTLDRTGDYMPWAVEPILAPNYNTVMLVVLAGWASMLVAFFWALPHAPEVFSVFMFMAILFLYSGWRMAKDMNVTLMFWLNSLLGATVFMGATFMASYGNSVPMFLVAVLANAIGQAVIIHMTKLFLKWRYGYKGD